jgi:hypothetical protein
MEIKEVLHILRNPYNSSAEVECKARLQAANLIEQFIEEEAERNKYKGVSDDDFD